MTWGELAEAVAEWQDRTGIDPSDLRVRLTLSDAVSSSAIPPVKFRPHLKVINLERGIVLDLEEMP